MSRTKFLFVLILLLALGAGIAYFFLPVRLGLSFPTGKCLLKVTETFEEKLTGYEVRETRQTQNDEWVLDFSKPEEKRQSYLMTLQWSERTKNETKKDAPPVALQFDSRKQKLEDVFSKEDADAYLPAFEVPLKIMLDAHKIVGIERANPKGDTPERRERAIRREAGKSVPVQTFCFLYADQISTLLPDKRVRPQSTWSRDIGLYTTWGGTQIIVQCELLRYSVRNDKQVAVIAYQGTLSGKSFPLGRLNGQEDTTKSFKLDLHGEFEVEVKTGLPVIHVVCAEVERVWAAPLPPDEGESSDAKAAEKKSEADRTITSTLKERRILKWEPEKSANSPE